MLERRWGAYIGALLCVACGDPDRRDGGSSFTTISTLGEQTSGTKDATGTTEAPQSESGSEAGCTNDDDCPDGQHCGPFSQVCLDPTECRVNEDCDEGFVCEEDTCSIGGDCGGFQFQIEPTQPNMMILLDRSGSMDGEVEGTGMNRWEVATAAIFTVTTEFDAEIRFGLTTYSSCVGGGCSAGTIEIPIADMNAAAIQAFLDTTVGVGSGDGQQVNGDGKIEYLCDSGDPETSTGVSLQGLVGEMSLLDPARPNVVLLLTDGAESDECTDQVNGPGGAQQLFTQDPSVRVFAVGMGGASIDQLEEIAVAGGTVEPYFADQPVDLQMALAAIAGSVASCTFTLDQVPPDAAMIYVFFDLDPAGVPNDGMNGWTYDPATNSITFHGQACADLQTGAVTDIDIVYGCNAPPAG
jgi:hypothetical protein